MLFRIVYMYMLDNLIMLLNLISLQWHVTVLVPRNKLQRLMASLQATVILAELS